MSEFGPRFAQQLWARLVRNERIQGAVQFAPVELVSSRRNTLSTFIVTAEHDELAAERVLMLMRLLGGGGVPTRAVGEAVRELQRYVGYTKPVLETKHARFKCAREKWTSCTGCTEAKQGSTGKKRIESTYGWNGTWLGTLYTHLSNSRPPLEGARGMPTLREGDMFLVDLVEADEVEMLRESCRATEVWMVSELRSLDGIRLREAVEPNGALERPVGKGNAGKVWGEVARRVAQDRGGREDIMGRVVRTGAESRCSKPLGAWVRPAMSDWGLATWTVDGVVMLGIPQSGPGSNHVECRQLARVEGQLPRWMGRGPS